MKESPHIGFVQWFPFEDKNLVELVCKDIKELGITSLRTAFSWADWERERGKEWFDFFIEALKDSGIKEFFPVLFYTPPHFARKDTQGNQLTSYPPQNLEDYAEFMETIVKRYGNLFTWIQLWNEPNWKVYWDWDMDPEWKLYAEMAKKAAKVAKKNGKKVVLGGLTPFEPEWITRMHEYELMKHIDAIALHASPGSWEERRRWFGWKTEINNTRALLKGHDLNAEIWITETGFSTIGKTEKEREDREQKQIEYFQKIKLLPVERVYWYGIRDQHSDTKTDDAINLNEEPKQVAYFFGFMYENGKKKKLYDFLKERKE